MRKLISLLFVGVLFFWSVSAIISPTSESEAFGQAMAAAAGGDSDWVCWGTKDEDKNYIILNTNVPFVWRCIKKEFDESSGDTNASNVFPKLMAYMIRIMMTVLVVWWFLWILVWGFMIASNGAFGSKQTGVKLILGVIAGLILLWASGIILNLINPNFFGTAS